jgi:peroxiredoxin
MIYRLSILLGLAAAFLLPLGCSTQPAPGSIHGHITLTKGWKPVVYILQPPSLSAVATSFQATVLDSVVLDASGQFTWSPATDTILPDLLLLAVQPAGSAYPNALDVESPAQANYMPISYDSQRSMHFTAQIDHFQHSFDNPNATADNLLLLKLKQLHQQAWQQENTLLTAPPTEENLMEQAEALTRFRQPLIQFADTTTAFLPAMVALRWVSPSGDYERVPEVLATQCQRWRTTTSHPWAQALCTWADEANLPVLVGRPIPNFEMPMLTGDTLMLHSLLGKKLTILDIWAAWCGPCRVENRNILAPLWQEHAANGLQIIGYSIDGDRPYWERAIVKDQATWPQASHLQGDEAPFFTALRIATIPANYLLDANGTIIAKNLHGAALTQFVQAYLSLH